jgi:hypothetical protein
MKPVGLALDDIPPFAVPLRFYLTAPWFGILAGLCWIRDGDAALVSRWLPGTLASTHLLALGFMAMVMVGSLFQVLPVLGGGPIPYARRVAPWVHALLALGTLALALGLDRMARGWMAAAAVLLLLGLGGFAVLVGLRVLRRTGGGDALFTIRLAALALLATVGLGLWMAAGHGWPALGIGYRAWTDTHARTGLLGFTLLLVMGVSFQVVPMFHVTPGFDSRVVKATGLGLFSGVLLLGLLPSLAVPAASLAALAGLGYAAAALRQLARRRRRRVEPLVAAWQLALVTLMAALLLGWTSVAMPGAAPFGLAPDAVAVLAALLFGLGFATTVILGMLGKIVPFLAFLHLQRRCLRHPRAIPLLPAMNQIVRDGEAWAQLGLHLLAVLAAAAAVVAPELGALAGILLVLDFALCLRNLSVAAWRYRRAGLAIAAVAALDGEAGVGVGTP